MAKPEYCKCCGDCTVCEDSCICVCMNDCGVCREIYIEEQEAQND